MALAAVEAFFGIGSEHARPLDIDTVREAFASVASPGPPGGRAPLARPSSWTPRTTRRAPAPTAEAITEAFGFSRLIGVVGRQRDKDVRGLLEAFEPVFAEVVVTRTPAAARSTPTNWPALAVEVFGEDRVQVEPRLDDALEAAITLAEEEGEYAGAGVLVTGSVITVGEARLLLGRG